MAIVITHGINWLMIPGFFICSGDIPLSFCRFFPVMVIANTCTTYQVGVQLFFNPALRRSGFRHVSFHSLKHTNASMRIQAGRNIEYLSTQLGIHPLTSRWTSRVICLCGIILKFKYSYYKTKHIKLLIYLCFIKFLAIAH